MVLLHLNLSCGVAVVTGYLKGRLLAAMPAMPDRQFARSVIALVDHDADGAFGLVISAAGDCATSEVFDQAGLPGLLSPDPMVLMGGPVEPRRGFVLHSPDWSGGNTVHAGRFAVTVSTDILAAIAEGEGPRHWQLVMGYAGWGPGQLDREIAEHSWHIAEADDHILSVVEPGQRWAALLARDGIDPARLVAGASSARPS